MAGEEAGRGGGADATAAVAKAVASVTRGAAARRRRRWPCVRRWKRGRRWQLEMAVVSASGRHCRLIAWGGKLVIVVVICKMKGKEGCFL